jgi:hypothetical protein
MKRCILALVSALTIMLFALATGQAASLADLAKIQVKVTTEAQVRAILGEPQKVESILKSKGSGRGLKERKDLIYKLDGKEVIIRIDPETGQVVKIIEL